jgi:pilus assembly protein CpaC
MILDHSNLNTTDRVIHSRRNRTHRAAFLLATVGTIVLLGGGVVGADAPDTTANPATTQPVVQAPTTRPSFVTDGLGADGNLDLVSGKTVVLTTRAPFKRMSIGQPDVADVNPIGPSNILVTAKKAGSTQLIIWDDQDRSQVIEISVQLDLAAVKRQIRSAFPDAHIEADALSDTILLRGQVASAQVAEQIVEMASAYGKVHNFLEVSGGQQVMLQVKFAEVSKKAEKDLGVNFGGTDGVSIFGNNGGGINPFTFTGGGSAPLLLGVPLTPSATGTIFGTGRYGNGNPFAYFIKVLRENNLLRVLAEPNVMAISGQEATFLAGGEIPIPVSQGGNSGISVEYHEYGIKLNFTPYVLGNGKIRLKVNPEVSDLDYANAVSIGGSPVPAFTKQTVTTTVELSEGQSFALAGLLNNNVTATTDAIPLLSDLPILGDLFRSTTYLRNETELVVLVTPKLVEPMNPGEVPSLPGEHWRYPNEVQLYLKGDLGGPMVERPKQTADDKHEGPPPQFHGDYGFAPQSPTAASPVPPAAPNTPVPMDTPAVGSPAAAAPTTAPAQ